MASERFRPTPAQYRRISAAALAALAAIIVTGASVRLTGSGLGCSDWPLCEAGRPVAPLAFHPLVEFINRLITGLVSAAVIAAVLGSYRRRGERRPDLIRWSWVLVVGVVAQIVIGAFVTLSELRYSVVALHFLISMALVWAATVLYVRSTRDDRPEDPPLGGAAKAIAGLATLVLVTGSIVTSAGPHPGARPGKYGAEKVVERLPLDLGTAARVHSASVWLLLAAIVVTIVQAQRRGDTTELNAMRPLLLLVVAQGALGYIQYATQVPAILVEFHVAGATAVWVVALLWALRSRTAPAPSTTVAA